jgi:hypothetical protein
MQNTVTLKNLEIPKSLDKVRIILFWEILKERNPLLLDPSYKEGKIYSKEAQEYIVQTWYGLYDDFYKEKNDQKTKLVLSQSYDEIKLQFKINTFVSNYNFLVSLNNDYKEILDLQTFIEYEQWFYKSFKELDGRIKLKLFEGVDVNLKIVKRFIESLQNAYNLKKKKVDKGVEEEITNVYEVVTRVEQIIERSIPNINKISVSQWLAYERRANEKIKAVKNGKQR